MLQSKIILKIRYYKSCILYHITYATIEVLLYQSPTIMLTFKINRSRISFGRKHYKYDMHNILACILSRHCILSILLMAKTSAQRVCKNK